MAGYEQTVYLLKKLYCVDKLKKRMKHTIYSILTRVFSHSTLTLNTPIQKKKKHNIIHFV